MLISYMRYVMNSKSLIIVTALSAVMSLAATASNENEPAAPEMTIKQQVAPEAQLNKPAIPEDVMKQLKQKMHTNKGVEDRNKKIQAELKSPVSSCEHLRIKQVKNTKMVCFYRMRFNQPITKEKYVQCAESYLTALIKDGNYYAYPNMIKLYTKENLQEKADEAITEFDKVKDKIEFKKYDECFTDKDI